MTRYIILVHDNYTNKIITSNNLYHFLNDIYCYWNIHCNLDFDNDYDDTMSVIEDLMIINEDKKYNDNVYIIHVLDTLKNIIY